jgi:cytochrome P450
LATTLGFFLAMIVNPEAQKKAQAEVDSVVGTERLPSITDRSSMPYVLSVLTEVLRWNPPVPLCQYLQRLAHTFADHVIITGLPHSTRKDDFYNGYHIPKDSIILPNIWYVFHSLYLARFDNRFPGS